MSDDVVLSGGGSTAVATDDQLHLARVTAALAEWCLDAASQVEAVAGSADTGADIPTALARPWLDPSSSSTPSSAGGEAAMRAASALRDAAVDAERLSGQLTLGAEAYGALERGVSELFESIAGAGAWVLGAVVGTVVRFHETDKQVAPGEAQFMEDMAVTWGRSLLVPFVAPAVAAFALISLDPKVWPALEATAQRTLRNLGSSAATARLLRTFVSSVDDALTGAAGAPVPFLRDYDPRTSGGVAGVALLIARGADTSGIFTPAPVDVKPIRPPGWTAPAGAPAAQPWAAMGPPRSPSELMERMPGNAPGAPQIRIEHHVDENGEDVWIVWSGGTVEMLPVPGSTEPWDARSNLNAVAGAAAESVQATMEAMRQAGIPEGARVMHVGYSQGGIVAAAIGASGQYDSSVVTFGAPVETIDLPEDVPALHVQHEEDPVPALSGERAEPVDGGRVARRSLYDGGPPPPPADGVDEPVPAHLARNYLDTARLLDGSSDPGVRDALRPLDGLADEGERIMYRADKALP